MNIEIDNNCCTRCMLCVQDCVYGVFREIDGKPVPAEPLLCNLCSHCLAVCPHGAIRHDRLDSEQIHKVDKKKIDASTYREIVLGRRSVRHYKDKPVPREVMEEILDLARYSPTAGNDQRVGYIVIQDKQEIRDISRAVFQSIVRIHTLARNPFMKLLLKPFKLLPDRYLRLMDYVREQHESTGRDYVLYDAPALILLHAPKKERFAAGNCSIAATNIMNYAHAMGLGTCCTGFMTMALQKKGKLRDKLFIPKTRDVFASLVMGYPAYLHTNTVSRKKPDIRWER